MSSTPKPRCLIAVMGCTGSGKSSFVNAILGKPEAAVSDGLESITVEVGQYVHHHESGMEVHIVDTPGFNNFRPKGTLLDLEILQKVGAFLKTEYDAKQGFTGIVFMHNIDTPTLDWQTQRRNRTLFKKLCGTDSMKNILVVTSFWDKLTNMADGVQKEGNLQTEDGLLKELHVGGAKFVRSGYFEPGEQPQDSSFFTPKQVVDYLLSLDPAYEVQKEIAKGAAIADTTSQFSLLEEFEQLKRETRVSLAKTRKELESIRSADDANRSHLEDLEREAEIMQERLNGWEKDSEDMRTKLSQWEDYHAQTASKEELDALISRHQKKLRDIQNEVVKFREASENLGQVDRQRIEQLNQTVAILRKDHSSDEMRPQMEIEQSAASTKDQGPNEQPGAVVGAIHEDLLNDFKKWEDLLPDFSLAHGATLTHWQTASPRRHENKVEKSDQLRESSPPNLLIALRMLFWANPRLLSRTNWNRPHRK
ncbi:P-loop containing nucleoside triphosphate hydrolase protein [Coprinopsis sp. MPI-PUGE-AT-0042]|nr:P-loop containing nucleoside triphosphate hydrolase protein [Coprinopsis sp. MPI-PUGE-AT-0042]